MSVGDHMFPGRGPDPKSFAMRHKARVRLQWRIAYWADWVVTAVVYCAGLTLYVLVVASLMKYLQP